MKVTDRHFLSADHKNHIHVKIWEPEGNVQGVIQIAHGMIDYIERYTAMAEYFAKKGYVVAGNDHLGHGDSVLTKEDDGYFTEKNASRCVVEDMHKLTAIMKKKYPDVPYFLLGHSMGSFLSRRYITEYGYELNGVLLLGTGNQPDIVVKSGILLAKLVRLIKGERYRSPFLNHLMFGSYNARVVNPVTDKDWVCGNAEVIKEYVADEKCSYLFTVNGYLGLLDTIAYVKKVSNIRKVPRDLPVILAAGTKDPVGGYGRDVKKLFVTYSRHFYDVELRLYEDCRHELHNELIQEDVFEDLYQWICKHR